MNLYIILSFKDEAKRYVFSHIVFKELHPYNYEPTAIIILTAGVNLH